MSWQGIYETAPESYCCIEQVVVGIACAESRHMLDISYPVSNGQVQAWGAMEAVWDHTFEHLLKLDAAARARTYILLTEPPLNPLSNRQEHMKQARWQCMMVLYYANNDRSPGTQKPFLHVAAMQTLPQAASASEG